MTLELQDVTKEYPGGVRALDGVSLAVQDGELVGVVGPSGSGKSTLLHVMGTLERPSGGRVSVAGADVGTLDDRELAGLRAGSIGFVFQAFFLIDGMTALENVAQGLLYSGTPVEQRTAAARVALERVGLGHRMHHRPEQLSGGERQRVAIARAVVARPAIVFADEPTGNLDSNASAEVLGFLRDAVNEHGQSIVMVTHDPLAAAYADRVVFLADGNVVGELRSPTADAVLERMKQLGS
jgi:putative ABC transport system ATP-binding protein